MTVAEQKQIVAEALALPKEARARLARLLWESLDLPKGKLSNKEWKIELEKRIEEMRTGKVKGIPGAQVMAELRVKYGSPEATETLSQEQWDEAWKKELEKRIEEMESGDDPGVPLEVIWEDLRKIADKR
jgi:putative addiction module component (TIGR02574 family)